MSKRLNTSELGPIRMGPPRTARDRVRNVAKGATINGTYKMNPGDALEAFRKDLLDILDDNC